MSRAKDGISGVPPPRRWFSERSAGFRHSGLGDRNPAACRRRHQPTWIPPV